MKSKQTSTEASRQGIVGAALAGAMILLPAAHAAENDVKPTQETPPSTEVKATAVKTKKGRKAGGDTALQNVTVTAQRREETAQKVPTAITVLNGENIIDSGIGRSASEILNFVPNASAGTQLHGRPRWWIRGVGTGQQQLDFPNPVGFYLDDVYISNASATGLPLFDVDRVEVLRGPQGTLWGKNTTGGAINVLSRKPGFSPDGYLRLDYGTWNDRIAQGAYGGPIVDDRLAARASFFYETRDGRFTNLNTGDEDGGFEDGAFRVQLLGKVTPNLEALLNVHFRDYNTAGNVATVTGNGVNGAYRNGYIPSRDKDTVNSNAPNESDTTQNGVSLNLKWQLGRYALTSITGYEDFNTEALTDSDNTPLEISRGWTEATSRQVSQEVRLASPREDRWNWVAGLFYFHETIDSETASAKLPAVATVVPGVASYSNTAFDHETNSFALFGSTTYNFTEDLRLTGGLRLTWEEKKLDFLRQATPTTTAAAFSNIGQWWELNSVSTPLTNRFSDNREKDWTAVTYDITPEYDIAENARVYFRYAHGIKSGGFNTAASTLAALNTLDPETLNAYELGAKTEWLDGRLNVNANVFHYDYQDIQVNVVGPLPPTNVAVSYLQNVDQGYANGGEIELEALPIRDLHISGSLGVLYTEFTDFQVLNGGGNFSGNEFVRSPHFSTLLRADYRFPFELFGGTKLLAGADWRYQSRQFFFTTNQTDPLLGEGGYSLVNARVSLVSPDEKLTLTGYVNNLLDEDYRNHALPGAAGATGAVTFWGEPRQLGVALTARWW